MSEYIFLFDLDSTITCKEILPTIAEKVNRQKEMLPALGQRQHDQWNQHHAV